MTQPREAYPVLDESQTRDDAAIANAMQRMEESEAEKEMHVRNTNNPPLAAAKSEPIPDASMSAVQAQPVYYAGTDQPVVFNVEPNQNEVRNNRSSPAVFAPPMQLQQGWTPSQQQQGGVPMQGGIMMIPLQQQQQGDNSNVYPQEQPVENTAVIDLGTIVDEMENELLEDRRRKVEKDRTWFKRMGWASVLTWPFTGCASLCAAPCLCYLGYKKKHEKVFGTTDRKSVVVLTFIILLLVLIPIAFVSMIKFSLMTQALPVCRYGDRAVCKDCLGENQTFPVVKNEEELSKLYSDEWLFEYRDVETKSSYDYWEFYLANGRPHHRGPHPGFHHHPVHPHNHPEHERRDRHEHHHKDEHHKHNKGKRDSTVEPEYTPLKYSGEKYFVPGTYESCMAGNGPISEKFMLNSKIMNSYTSLESKNTTELPDNQTAPYIHLRGRDIVTSMIYWANKHVNETVHEEAVDEQEADGKRHGSDHDDDEQDDDVHDDDRHGHNGKHKWGKGKKVKGKKGKGKMLRALQNVHEDEDDFWWFEDEEDHEDEEHEHEERYDEEHDDEKKEHESEDNATLYYTTTGRAEFVFVCGRDDDNCESKCDCLRGEFFDMFPWAVLGAFVSAVFLSVGIWVAYKLVMHTKRFQAYLDEEKKSTSNSNIAQRNFGSGTVGGGRAANTANYTPNTNTVAPMNTAEPLEQPMVLNGAMVNKLQGGQAQQSPQQFYVQPVQPVATAPPQSQNYNQNQTPIVIVTGQPVSDEPSAFTRQEGTPVVM